ncbi:DUF3011 domain-containing protein [Terriglobus albidus]|uniref:DUF3011 domain-containing protein n=1 Tax=Terriglobus albidus TaxID=1592106 RepID=A0A5B9E9I0_9BACT|nr:DUF3011 domain-containing protein [Terriglobus albidus]QEE27270.1 DUF3011 domain-containing protein [Terriglobus albidus]
MKQLRFLLFILSFLALGTLSLKAQSGTTDREGAKLTCASDDGKRHYCRADTSRGVRMLNQRSGSPCIQGDTWGYDRRGIWVDRGCRADFLVRADVFQGGGPGPQPYPGGPRPPDNGWSGPSNGVITCESNDMGRNYCRVPIRGGVRLIKQRSGSPCRQGETWGYDRGGIWVDRGCRADFAIR